MSEDGQDNDDRNKTDDHSYHKAEPRRSDGEDLRECQEYLGPKIKGGNKRINSYFSHHLNIKYTHAYIPAHNIFLEVTWQKNQRAERIQNK